MRKQSLKQPYIYIYIYSCVHVCNVSEYLFMCVFYIYMCVF